MCLLYLYFVGEVLEKVLLSLKLFGISNVVLYFFDFKVLNEKYYGIFECYLFESIGNVIIDCDVFCRSRVVIFEGIFVVSLFVIFC